MINEKIEVAYVLVILFVHWCADFILQTDKQAKGKSKNWRDLLSHTSSYTFYTAIGWMALLPWSFYMPNIFTILDGHVNIPLAAIVTFVCHTLTDYFTSRLNSKLWAEGKTHLFFVSLGFDQFLHFVQLIITYHLLS
jgi:hypothetical protein